MEGVAMKVLVTGADGMLGGDICLAFANAGYDVIRTNRMSLDVCDAESALRVIASERPDVVVHAAAHTDADAGEVSPDIPYRVNTIGTWNVALACARSGAQLVYISSCGVFDGTKTTPYTELDVPAPLTHHHRSKLEAERIAASLVHDHFILRPGWLFGGRGDHRKNFVAQRFREAAGKESIVSANDRFGSPTYTLDFANAALEIIASQAFGLYHVVNSAPATRFEYVTECVAALGLRTRVDPVTSDRFPRAAPVPRSEALDTYFMRLRGFKPMRPWREALTEYTRTRLLPELNPSTAARA